MKFFAHGKLLLTSEYAVLGGAEALAMPTKLGQHLEVTPLDKAVILWKSIDEHGVVWYQNNFEKTSFTPKESGSEITTRLQQLFTELAQHNPSIWESANGFSFTTTLDFNRSWGLGSSSTLVSLLAQWARINPHLLLKAVFGGSGYDIACATAQGPIIYQRNGAANPLSKNVSFDPPFKTQLYFIHLNQKQDSQKAVAAFDRNLLTEEKINTFNTLTAAFLKETDLALFQKLIFQHEILVGDILGSMPVQQRLFSDYTGAIKSLGAWGGDFILACGNKQTPTYFAQKGYSICFSYEEFIYDVS